MMRDREYQRKETTTPVKNTTFAIALISSASPLTEKIRPNPLIKFNFSGLKLKLLALKVKPLPTMDCVNKMKIIVGIPKIAAPDKIIENARHELCVFAENNSSGCPNENNDPQTSRIPLEKKPKEPSIRSAEAPEAKTSISLEESTSPSSRAFSSRRWVGSSVLSCACSFSAIITSSQN